MRRFVLALAVVTSCRSARTDEIDALELGPDLVEVGYGETFRIDARAKAGEIVWTQIAGEPLESIAVADRGFRFSARMPSLGALVPGELPWGIVPISPRTRGEAVLEAEYRPASGSGSVRRSIRVAAAARSRGLPNVPVGQRLYLGGSGWHLASGPANAAAAVREVHGVSTFTPDQSGLFTLNDAKSRALRVQAGRYDDTLLDCARTGCHLELSASIERSPMTYALARLLERPTTAQAPACALACHATGEPGTHDGGFLDVSHELGSSAPLDGVKDIGSLPRPLRRLGGVGCLACHGPSALPEADARWSILRSDVCAYCHDAPRRYGHVAGWRESAMATADRDPNARDRLECAGCHTTWGFLARTGATPAEHPDARRPPDGTGALGIACAACHDPHAPAGPSSPRALLRPVFVSAAFDDLPEPGRTKSAACLACHGSDVGAPLARASSALIVAGRGGVDPDTGAPLSGPSPHASVSNGCVGCHREGPADLEAGSNHAFRASRAQCATCHKVAPALPASLEAEARELWGRLVALGVIENGAVSPSRPPHASASIRSHERSALARAALNVSLVLEDPSADAHNLPYARMLLARSKQSMAALH
jgi:hypothetical protein